MTPPSVVFLGVPRETELLRLVILDGPERLRWKSIEWRRDQCREGMTIRFPRPAAPTPFVAADPVVEAVLFAPAAVDEYRVVAVEFRPRRPGELLHVAHAPLLAPDAFSGAPHWLVLGYRWLALRYEGESS